MAVLSVVGDAVLLDIAGLGVTDTFWNGVLTESPSMNVHAVPGGGTVYANGLLLTDAGQVRYVDATAGLPGDTVWANGLPRSGGALCISTGALSTYSNGIPFAANGAVRAGIIV